MLQQGDETREAYEWALLYWESHYFRNEVIWDDDGGLGRDTLSQPQTGLPFGRNFIIDADGVVAAPSFGHAPQSTIESMCPFGKRRGTMGSFE